MSITKPKVYLGDGVYVAHDMHPHSHAVILTTEDGFQVTNRIVLEPETLELLLRWLEVLKGY